MKTILKSKCIIVLILVSPALRSNYFFNKTIKWIVVVISILLYGLYWLDNNFYSIPHRITICRC